MGRYLDVDELKKFAKSDKGDDIATYEDAIGAAQQFLDRATGRYLAVAAVDPTARTYRPHSFRSTMLWIHDCIGTPVVVEDGATLVAGTDYVLLPVNGITTAGEPVPFTSIERLANFWHWDDNKLTVSVTARWGWAAVPPQAKTACMMVAKMILDGRDLKHGLAGLSEFGGVTDRDSRTVTTFVQQYRSHGSWGIA